jgi:hypothetical protein
MIDKNVRFLNPAGHTLDVDLARDEPSHIHIPRPSRRLRQDDVTTSVEVTPGELPKLTLVVGRGKWHARASGSS